MADAERPILRITERDKVTKKAISGTLDTSHLSQRRKTEIERECPGCPANMAKTIFKEAGRGVAPPFSCQNMSWGAGNPRVDFAPSKEGDKVSSNLNLFLSDAACHPVRGK